jgi:hypothetical protein
LYNKHLTLFKLIILFLFSLAYLLRFIINENLERREKMKKLSAFLTGLWISLILITGSFEISLAKGNRAVSQIDTLLGVQVIINQPVEMEAKRNFIYIEPGPVKSDKIAGEIFAGGAGALLGGVLGAGIGYSLTYKENEGDWFNLSGVPGAVVGYTIASNLGCALGVYLIGNSGDEKGSFGDAFGGSVAGSLLGGGLAYLIAQTDKEADGISYEYAVFVVAGQATGAIIGFNHSRKKKAKIPSEGLLNINSGKLSLAFPQVDISKDSDYKVNLFQVKF